MSSILTPSAESVTGKDPPSRAARGGGDVGHARVASRAETAGGTVCPKGTLAHHGEASQWLARAPGWKPDERAERLVGSFPTFSARIRGVRIIPTQKGPDRDLAILLWTTVAVLATVIFVAYHAFH